MAKLGKNYKATTFSANTDKFPSSTTIDNLNKMIDSTGVYVWDYDKTDTLTKHDLLTKGDSLVINIERRGTGVTYSGKFTGVLNSDADASLARFENILPVEYSPAAGTFVDIESTLDKFEGSMVDDRDLLVFAHSDASTQTVSFGGTYIGGPVLVYKTSKRKHLSESTKVSASTVDAIFQEFKEATNKMPKSPKKADITTTPFDVDPDGVAISGSGVATLSQYGRAIDVSLELDSNITDETGQFRVHMPKAPLKPAVDVNVAAIVTVTDSEGLVEYFKFKALYQSTGDLVVFYDDNFRNLNQPGFLSRLQASVYF